MNTMLANYLQSCIDPTLAWGNDAVPPGQQKLEFDAYGKARAALNLFLLVRSTPEGQAGLNEWDVVSRNLDKAGTDAIGGKLSIFFIDEYFDQSRALAATGLAHDRDTAEILFGGFARYLAAVEPALLKEVEQVRRADTRKLESEVKKALTNKCNYFIHDVVVQMSYFCLQSEWRKRQGAPNSVDGIKNGPRINVADRALALLIQTLDHHIESAGIATDSDATFIAAEVCTKFRRPYLHLKNLERLCIYRASALALREQEQQLIDDFLCGRGTNVSNPPVEEDADDGIEDAEESNTDEAPPEDESETSDDYPWPKKETKYDKLKKEIEENLALYPLEQDVSDGTLEEAIRIRITTDILSSFIRLASGQLTDDEKAGIKARQSILRERTPVLAKQSGIADVEWNGQWQRTLQLRYAPETISTKDPLLFHAQLAQHLNDPTIEKPTDKELAQDLGWNKTRFPGVVKQLSFGLVCWGLAARLFEEDADEDAALFLNSTVNYLIRCTFDKWTLLPIYVGSNTYLIRQNAT